MNLIDGLLGQPVAWLGIEEPQKKTKLSEIQSRMDNISHSLVRYSDSGEHEYNSNSERELNGPNKTSLCQKRLAFLSSIVIEVS